MHVERVLRAEHDADVFMCGDVSEQSVQAHLLWPFERFKFEIVDHDERFLFAGPLLRRRNVGQEHSANVIVLLRVSTVAVNDVHSFERRLLSHENVLHGCSFTAVGGPRRTARKGWGKLSRSPASSHDS